MTRAEPLRSGTVAPAPIAWPGAVTAAACLTFDIDAEAAVLTADISSISRMTPMSHQSYGPLVGVPRILALLERHDSRPPSSSPATRRSATRHVVRAIAEAGHEIAHHCYFHENTVGMDAATEAAMLDLGLRRCATSPGSGRSATGPRMWEMNYHTPRLLAQRGFSTTPA